MTARYGMLIVEAAEGQRTLYRLDAPVSTLGRGSENDIVLVDLRVSRRHARLSCSPERVEVEDLGSANGFVHNRKWVRRATLAHRDLLRFGSTRLRYLAPGVELQAAETAVTMAGAALHKNVADHSCPRIVVSRPGWTHAFRIDQPRMTLGRSSKADIQIDDPGISRVHAVIEQEGEGYVLRDNASRHGIFVEGQRVSQIALAPRVTVAIGDATLVFRAPFDHDDLSVVTAATSASPSAGSGRAPAIERLGEAPGEQAPQAVPRRAPTRAVATGRQPVIVIPGFMGSTLLSERQQVWPDVRRFLKEPEYLKLPEEPRLQPGGLVEEVVVIPGLVKLDAYRSLADYLIEGLQYRLDESLFCFAYDWRRDLRHAARLLGEAIVAWEELCDRSHGKFVIVAHSAGGLVARYYVERMGGRHHVDRLILLGCPNRGTLRPLEVMLGRRGVLPFRMRKQQVREVMATFPATYQLLPLLPRVFDDHDQAIDLFADRDWVPEAVHPLLDDARAFLDELGTRSRVPVVSIFGYGQRTVTRIRVKRDKDGRLTAPSFEETDGGDGTVTQASALLEGSEIHPVYQHHGALYTDPDVKMRLRLELLGQPE